VATTLETPPTPAKRTSEEDLVRAAKRKDRITTWGWRIAGYVFFLGIWELASGRLMDETLLPGPSTVFETFGYLWGTGEVPGAFATTLARIGVGFAIAFVVGVGVGMLMQNRFLNGFFRDAVTIGVTTPGLIWALITAIIFGNRTAGPIIAIVLTTFAIITVNVSEGIKSLPKGPHRHGEVVRCGGIQTQPAHRHSAPSVLRQEFGKEL
jgi:NitT/TauT family transport system permease protein